MHAFVRAAVAAGALFSASFASAQAPQEPQFTPEAFRAHVAFLADDLLEGREAGTRGYDMAAHYVARQFESLGLTPAGDNGTWFQAVPLQERALGAGGASLTVTGARGVYQTFRNGGDVIIRPSALTTEEKVEAGTVFVGYGIDAPAHGFDDYRGLDVRGKIVVLLSGTPRGTPSELGAHLGSEKYRMAMARGAVGAVTVDTNLSARVFPWAKRLPYAPLPRMTWMRPDGTPFVEAPGIRAAAAANEPAAQALFVGARTSLAQVRAEADRVGGKPKGFPLRARAILQVSSVHRTLSSPNVVALLPGSDPALKNEVVVVMGHLDHLGVRPSNPGDKIYNGAMDNATGIAAMLETARAFVESGRRPKRSILFLAVTAEEKGLLGAEYFTEHPTVPLARIAGVVNIDMPILTYDFGDIVAFGADSSTLGAVAERAAGRIGVKLSPDPAPEQGTFTRSDHYTFVRKGVPSIYLDTGLADAAGGTSGEAAIETFVSRHYHEPSDDMSQPIDWGAAAKFARINWLIAREIADGDERPRWYQGDVFADAFARDAPRAARPVVAAR